ncbi:DUF1015 domain-containing protein [Bacillus suaedaesalsae]|uniref:DUF1015 domain-containing protein n=1 Tax=Bacillus suaedaesalsae TaxID=2810349 RepID=A0ABS2DMA0_9BACI|nr:DUF1015 family protein [Bacillus suaedaesalsae]MBM6619624.1 DUF1015 domain-containing protein [Bacillus suaedaesalsae]
MVSIRPFKAFRPKSELAEQTAALPYDVVSTSEAKELTKNNPYSFLRVDKAEIDFDETVSPYDDKVYAYAKKNLETFIREGILIQDDEHCFYIYQLQRLHHTQIGLVVCSSVQDYKDNYIKKHELTRHAKEQDRIRHIDETNAHVGPIFMTYHDNIGVNSLLKKWVARHETLYSFIAEDGVTHRVWKIDDLETISLLQAKFVDVSSVYIADGHHRTEAAVKVAEKRRKQNPNHTGEEEYNFFLSVLFPQDQVQILDYNRIVATLNGMTVDRLIAKLAERFQIREVGRRSYRPDQKHTFGMYVNRKWYKLTVKEKDLHHTDPVKLLDATILQEMLLQPILGINDIRTDERIDFIGGIRGLKALEQAVHSGKAQVAFSLFPTSIAELMTVSDAGKIMPPKSTWFEPKLRTGLFVHLLE